MEAAGARDAFERPASRGDAPDSTAAMLGGAVTGFAAFTVMILLGIAFEVSSAAFAAAGVIPRADGGRLGGAIVWLALSAIVAGFVGGNVLNRLAPRDAYRPVLFALVSWAGGLVLTMIVGISGASAWCMSGAGVMVSDASGSAAPSHARTAAWTAAPPGGYRPADDSFAEMPLTEAREDSTRAAAGLAWAIVLMPLLGLSAAVASASLRRRDDPLAGAGNIT